MQVLEGDDGLALDVTRAGLVILEIGDGAVWRHNATARERFRVREHDVITSVNGVSDPAGMLTIMANLKHYCIDVVRPEVTNIVIDKAIGNWGLSLRVTPGSNCMEILDIQHGDISTYNLSMPPERQVSLGSIIRSVNGVSGSVRHMMKEMEMGVKHAQVELTLLRVTVSEMQVPLQRVVV